MSDFERKMDSKGYRILKIIADLFILNFEFMITVIFSLTFLIFPSIFALVETCKREKETKVSLGIRPDDYIGIKFRELVEKEGMSQTKLFELIVY